MASTLPLPTRDSPKTPVVVILKDIKVSLYSPPGNVIPWYINPLLKHVREANQTPRPYHLAWVEYGSVHCAGPSLSVTPFSLFDSHNKSTKLPTGHKTSETHSGMTALDGYYAAIRMFDEFQRDTKHDPEEEFSYHLWHIAAGQDDESDPSYFSLSQTFWNLTWDTIPAELLSRNINFSAILLRHCPRYSALFSAVSPQRIEPWFDFCPHHTILLSGFEHPLTPKLEDVAPSTVLSKRPADAPVERRARRLKTEDSSQSITTLSPRQLVYTPPTISQARVKATDSPSESSPCEGQDMMNNQWSGLLSWSGEESEVCASVQATDGVRDPRLSVWPLHLRLEIVGTRMRALDFQAWIFKHRAPVARIQCVAGTGEQDFDELVKLLREDRRVAIVRLETEGSSKRGLVLAPLHGGLLCAAFLTFDIPELPAKAPSEPPQQQKELKVDCTHVVDIPLENANTCDNQTNVFVGSPAQSTLPQQFPSQQPQVCVQGPIPQPRARVQGSIPQPQPCVQGPLPAGAQGPLPQPPARVQGPQPQPQPCVQGPLPHPPAYIQGPPPHTQAQQGKRRASLDAQHVLSGELVSGNSELATTAENNVDIGFHLTESSWDVRLYNGDLNAVGVVPGQTVGVTQEAAEFFQFINPYPFD